MGLCVSMRSHNIHTMRTELLRIIAHPVTHSGAECVIVRRVVQFQQPIRCGLIVVHFVEHFAQRVDDLCAVHEGDPRWYLHIIDHREGGWGIPQDFVIYRNIPRRRDGPIHGYMCTIDKICRVVCATSADFLRWYMCISVSDQYKKREDFSSP